MACVCSREFLGWHSYNFLNKKYTNHETIYYKIASTVNTKSMVSNFFKVNKLFRWYFEIYWYNFLRIAYLFMTNDAQFQ